TIVAADTARFYFNLLAADAQLAVLQDTLKTRDESVSLQTDRYQAGIIGDYDLGTAQAERASVAADVAVAQRAVAEFESALAVLLGRSPREVFTPQLSRNVAMSWGAGVPTIPSGIPSDILARRPDIRAAESQLAAADMRIDVARADYFPSISLTGLLGGEAGALRNIFSGGAFIWSIGAAIAQPIIGFKAIEANVESKTAARNELTVAYTKTVQTLHGLRVGDGQFIACGSLRFNVRLDRLESDDRLRDRRADAPDERASTENVSQGAGFSTEQTRQGDRGKVIG